MAEITYGMNQSLMMSNVLSVNYNIVGDEIAVAFQDMIQTAVAAGYTPKSNPFYSCPHIGELEDGTYNITVYLPVHEDYLGKEEIMEGTAYNSYFWFLEWQEYELLERKLLTLIRGYTC